MIPHRLIMKQFLSHIESSIDFSKFNAALILGSYNSNTEESNGAGKSAILEAIRWVLFDKARHKKKDDVVKRDATACFVQFDFEIDNILYRVERTRNKVVGETDVRLYQWDGAGFSQIECDTNTATDNKIVKIISFNHEVFTNSVYFKQGDISLFTKSTPGKRKDILKALMKLEMWDEYQKVAKKHAAKLNTQIEQKKELIEDSILLAKTISDREKEIDQISTSIKKNNRKFNRLNRKLVNKKYEIQSIPNDADEQLEVLEKEYNEAKKRFTQVRNAISKNKDKISKTKDNIAVYKQKVQNLNALIKAQNSIDIEAARKGLTRGYIKSKHLQEKIAHLKKDIDNDACDNCLRPISKKEIKNIKELRQQRLESLQEEYNGIIEKLKKSEQKFKDMEAIVMKGQDAQIQKSKLEVKIASFKSSLQVIATENKSLTNELNTIKANGYKDKIEELREKYSKERLDTLCAEAKSIEQQLREIKKTVDSLNVEYGVAISSREELIKKQEAQASIQNEIDRLNNDYKIYDKLKHLFGKDGIQSVIIENVIDELENYTNNTLSKICNEPTSISIKMQKQSESGSWTETFDIEVHVGNRQDDFEALSGGEQFRISLALRLALSKILSKRMGGEVRFLLLDEVSSSLDEKGLVMFANIVKQLSSEMKVMIITHDNRLKDHFEDIIMVDKDSSGSRASI